MWSQDPSVLGLVLTNWWMKTDSANYWWDELSQGLQVLGPEVRDLWTYTGGWGWVTGLLMGEESLQAVMGSRISKAAGVLVGEVESWGGCLKGLVWPGARASSSGVGNLLMLTVYREDPIVALDSSGTLMTECVSQSGRHEHLCSPGGFQFHPSWKPLQDGQMGQAQSHF